MRFHRWFYTLPLRVRSLFRRNRVEDELNEELRYHLERPVMKHREASPTWRVHRG